MAAEKSGNTRPKREEDGGGTYIRMRLSSFIVLLFVFLVGTGMAYIGGVMSGRAYIAQPSLPKAEAGAPPAGESAGESGKAPILAAEELEFARVLRNQKSSPAIAAAPPVKKDEILGGEVVTHEAMAPAAGPADNDAIPETAAEENVSGNNAGVYDYVFQMGAFREENQADNLRQLLEGHALRTRLRRNGKLYVVQVLLRGNAERAAEVGRIAQDLKLGPPLETARKPVEAQKP